MLSQSCNHTCDNIVLAERYLSGDLSQKVQVHNLEFVSASVCKMIGT